MSKKPKHNRKLCIAKVVNVHGIQGLVKMQVFLENPLGLAKLGPFTSADGKKTYSVDIRGQTKGTLLCAIKGVTDRNAAEEMRGVEFFVERDALPEIDNGEEFYATDLIGMDIRLSGTNDAIGQVREIQNHGAGDIVVVTYKQRGKRDDMFAFTYDIFPEVNLDQRYLIFIPPEEVLGQEEEP